MNMSERNRPVTDTELDELLPEDGYEIIKPPAGYKKITTPSRKLDATPVNQKSRFTMHQEDSQLRRDSDIMSQNSELPYMSQDDLEQFKGLVGDGDDQNLTKEQVRDKKIMTLLLKIKNGTPPIRKTALKQIAEKAREFGAGPLF